MVVSAALVTRQLKTDIRISRWQCFLEMLVTGINEQIKEVGLKQPKRYIGFIGTLFLFIAVANLIDHFSLVRATNRIIVYYSSARHLSAICSALFRNRGDWLFGVFNPT